MQTQFPIQQQQLQIPSNNFPKNPLLQPQLPIPTYPHTSNKLVQPIDQPIPPLAPIPSVTIASTETTPNPPYIEKIFLSRGGHATTRTFPNPCLKEEFASQEPFKDQKIRGPSLQNEDLEISSSHPYQIQEKIEEPWTTYDEENTLKPEIE